MSTYGNGPPKDLLDPFLDRYQLPAFVHFFESDLTARTSTYKVHFTD